MRIFYFLLISLIAVSCTQSHRPGASNAPLATVERWGLFELSLPGPSSGNPFTESQLHARFTHASGATLDVDGFYDGDGVYKIRCMPTLVGRWTYVTTSNRRALDRQTGSFIATEAGTGNHGPVQVRNTYHFAYADGTPYFQLGTTCYSWVHQPIATEERTLSTLASSPFNKIRFCILPREYSAKPASDGGWDKPVRFPFVGTPPHQWDLTRFDTSYFQHLDQRIANLRDLGIEADLILFHPYDHDQMGFDRMPPEVDDRYIRYVVARYGAYRNVWWSLANEFDLLQKKTTSDWDRFFHLIVASDPYAHLRSIHNCRKIYNNTQPWVTHASIQNGSALADFGRAILYRDVYEKPIVFDEINYEGNIAQRWGQLTGEQMTAEFWQATIAGTYAGHSEIFNEPGKQWLATGGKLFGTSAPRIAFLKKILETTPREGIEPIDKWRDVQTAGKPGDYYLIYFGQAEPAMWVFSLPKSNLTGGMQFKVDIIDTWNMTITPTGGIWTIKADGKYRFRSQEQAYLVLPSRPYIALRVTRLPSATSQPATTGAATIPAGE